MNWMANEKWTEWRKDITRFIDTYTLSQSAINILFVVSLLVVFIAVCALNFLQPLFTDDWEYAFCHRVYEFANRELVSNERISSIGDIIRSQYEHYFTWGGRSVNHFVAQVLLFIGSPYNKILNSLAYVALTYVIYLLAKTSRTSLSLYFLINLLIFFFQPVLGSTILWITGSANYLWGTLIVLVFLLPYKHFYNDLQSATNSYLKAVLIFVGGLVAGWTNENIVAASLFMLVIFYIYLYVSKIKIPLWYYTGFVGLLIGFIIMISAPGNYLRYQASIEGQGKVGISQLTLWIDQFGTAISGIFFYLSGIILLYFLFLFLYYYWGVKDNRNILASILFFITAMVATLVMGFSPDFPERAWFGIIIFIIIGIAILYDSLDFQISCMKNLRLLTFSLIGIMFIGYYVSGYKDLSKAKDVFDKREQIMAEKKEEGVMDFVFEYEIKSKSRINNLYDLTNDSTFWTNCFYARYYGVNSVVVIRSEYK